jgi:hypothetical protein
MATVKMAEASEVVEREDKEVLQFTKEAKLPTLWGRQGAKYLVSCISHSLMVQNLQ